MISRLDDILKKTESVLLTSPHNMQYFTGFSGGEGAALIAGESRILFTDSRYTEQAQGETQKNGFKVVQTNAYIATACEEIGALGLKEVLFEDGSLCVAEYRILEESLKNVQFIAGTKKLSELRMIKTEAELELLQKAEKIACSAFRHVLGFIKPGITENDLANELEYFMRKNGGEGASFNAIAISGKKTSLPHGKPSVKKIELGDFVTIDFGCLCGGYCSDMTRTVVVGKANAEQKKIYNIVKHAQQTGLEHICEGAVASKVDAVAREVIERAGYGKYFGHSLGHGVGLLVHELPNLSPKSDVVLKENMIVTCEPGIYIPGFGGVRIEDMVCVKKNGNLNFTCEEKGLIEL